MCARVCECVYRRAGCMGNVFSTWFSFDLYSPISYPIIPVLFAPSICVSCVCVCVCVCLDKPSR